MKISIVTPVLQRPEYLDQTIRSVVTQQGDFEIEYIVQNGGTDSQVIAILTKWEELIKTGQFESQCISLTFKWYSEKDSGMYEALNRGFARTSGDVLAWINSDDLYHPNAFVTISQIFETFDSVEWLTGIPNSFNRFGSQVGFDKIPQAYSREFIKRGYYDLRFIKYGFNWIAQDCCFWRRSLWEKVGGKLDDSMKMAADFYLWQSFGQHTDLVKVNSFLGGYRFHGDQITANQDDYASELPKRLPPGLNIRLVLLLLNTFPRVNWILLAIFKRGLLLKMLGVNHQWLLGWTIHWNFDAGKWQLVRLPII